MTAKGSAFYIDTEESGENGVKRGLQWLRDQGGSGLIVVDILNTLDDLPLGLTKPEISTLKTGGSVANGTGSLTALSKRKLGTQWSGPVLVIHPSSALLDEVDKLNLVTSVLVVPLLKSEVQAWISRWSAQPLDAQGAVVPPAETVVTEASPDDATLRKALLDLVPGEVRSLANSSDRDRAIDLFDRLKKGGVNYQPAQVATLLITVHGWNVDNAKIVAEIAEQVQKGNAPRKSKTYRPVWNDNIIDEWMKNP